MQTQALTMKQDGQPFGDGQALAQGLGWFSLGLGLAELGAPGALAHLAGVPDNARMRRTVQALGAREIAHGVAILARSRSPMPVWSRVVGDVIDLAVLGWALRSRRSNTERVLISMAAIAGVTAIDLLASRRLQREAAARPTTAAITISRTPVQVYVAWRNLQDLPRFMQHLESVSMLDERRSLWSAKTPVGPTVEWEAELVDDRPGERIAWRTLEGSDLDHRGEVTFRAAPGGRGTEVRVEISAGSRGGAVGAAIARAFAGPQVKADLRRFKQVLETGSIVHSDASVHPGLHPARPSEAKGALLP